MNAQQKASQELLEVNEKRKKKEKSYNKIE